MTLRLGQTLEIAAYKALLSQKSLPVLGGFVDLNVHDDSTLYKKTEPPSLISGRSDPEDRRFDFLLFHPTAGSVGIEAKNTRQWLYPDHDDIRELISKACALDAIPVLVARRFPFITFHLLLHAGGVVHQVYNQLFPSAAAALAHQAAHKDLIGYHDVRVGNEPDERLLKFMINDLQSQLPAARIRFDAAKPSLAKFAEGSLGLRDLLHAIGSPYEFE